MKPLAPACRAAINPISDWPGSAAAPPLRDCGGAGKQAGDSPPGPGFLSPSVPVAGPRVSGYDDTPSHHPPANAADPPAASAEPTAAASPSPAAAGPHAAAGNCSPAAPAGDRSPMLQQVSIPLCSSR